MPEQKLKIGKIPYANLFPIFHMLERECDCSGYEFVEGVPSALNQMLRAGEIDVSPSSSIEYLRYSNEYAIVENHSISSKGCVGSIILLSKKPIEGLNGLPVLTSSQSETSVALLRIVLEKFYKVRCNLRTADIHLDSLPSVAEAYLLIGDDALKAVKSYELQVTSENKNSQLYIYDLGELWHKNTGLSFTFALWIYRKDCCKEKAELLERFKNDLNGSKKRALENFKIIASESPLKGILTENELIAYWENISYDFGDEHRKGFELFRKFSGELGLI
ncbi:MAG: menaquinone biosynthesis protein [Thermodesulfovibrionales bacterium]|nr:menaquinone biosynthesis protein [Thermodesulfovibrionales bacterium]